MSTQYTLCLDAGSHYAPISAHASINEARAALRDRPKQLAAAYAHMSTQTTCQEHTVIVSGSVAATLTAPTTTSSAEADAAFAELEARIVESWVADRKSAKRK